MYIISRDKGKVLILKDISGIKKQDYRIPEKIV